MRRLALAAALAVIFSSNCLPAMGQFTTTDLKRFGTDIVRQVAGRRLNRSGIKEVQRRLNERGYAAGPVDGAFGRSTRRAIAAFQRDSGLPVTGFPDASLLGALRSRPATNQQGGERQGLMGFVTMPGFDLPGDDYRNGLSDPKLKGISLSGCTKLCAQDQRCKAFTFNTQNSVCILKDAVPRRAPFGTAISGIKREQPSVPGEIAKDRTSGVPLAQADANGLAGVVVRDGRVETSAGGGLSWLHGSAADKNAEALRYALVRLAFTRFPDLWNDPELAFAAMRLVDGQTQARILRSAGVDPAILNAPRRKLYLDKDSYQNGLDEFARRALLAAIRKQLPPIIAAHAPKLPIAMFLPCKITLKEYDFKRKAFPIFGGRGNCNTVQFSSSGYGEAVFGYNPEIQITAPIPTYRLRYDIPVPESQARAFRANLYASSRHRSSSFQFGAMGIKARITDIVDMGAQDGSRYFKLKVAVEDEAVYRADDLSKPLIHLGTKPLPSSKTVSAKPQGPVPLNSDTLDLMMLAHQTAHFDTASFRAWAARLTSFYPGGHRPWAAFFPPEVIEKLTYGKPVEPFFIENFGEWNKARARALPETVYLETRRGTLKQLAKRSGHQKAGHVEVFESPDSSDKTFQRKIAKRLSIPETQLLIAHFYSAWPDARQLIGVKNAEIIFVLPKPKTEYAVAVNQGQLPREAGLHVFADLRVAGVHIDRAANDETLLVLNVIPTAAHVTMPDQKDMEVGSATFKAIDVATMQKKLESFRTKAADMKAKENAAKLAAEKVKTEKLTADHEKLQNADIIGIRIGMSLSEAEQIIRKHMKVGWVAELNKKKFPTFNEGRNLVPYRNLRIFVSEPSKEQREQIVLFSSPDVGDRVIAVAREVSLPKGVATDVMNQRLREKYGSKPLNGSSDAWNAWTEDFGYRNMTNEPGDSWASSSCEAQLTDTNILSLRFTEGTRPTDAALVNAFGDTPLIEVYGGISNWIAPQSEHEWVPQKWQHCGMTVISRFSREQVSDGYMADSLQVALLDLSIYAKHAKQIKFEKQSSGKAPDL